jgi:hypothetical protein
MRGRPTFGGFRHRRRRGRLFRVRFLGRLFPGASLHLLHQTLNATGFQERRRQLRLVILLVDHAVQTHQTSHLVLFVLVLMQAGPTAWSAGPQSAGIDLDGRRGGCDPAGRQFAGPVAGRSLVTLLLQLAANHGGDALDVTETDREAGQLEGERGVGEGR